MSAAPRFPILLSIPVEFFFFFLICRNTHLIREHLLMVRVGFRSGLDTTTGDVELSVATHMTFPSHYGTVTKIHAGS